MPEAQFLFVNSSGNGNIQADKTPRSFLMQKIRSERPWSTKSPRKRKSSTRPPKAAASRAPSKLGKSSSASPKTLSSSLAPSDTASERSTSVEPSMHSTGSERADYKAEDVQVELTPAACAVCGLPVLSQGLLCIDCETTYSDRGPIQSWSLQDGREIMMNGNATVEALPTTSWRPSPSCQYASYLDASLILTGADLAPSLPIPTSLPYGSQGTLSQPQWGSQPFTTIPIPYEQSMNAFPMPSNDATYGVPYHASSVTAAYEGGPIPTYWVGEASYVPRTRPL